MIDPDASVARLSSELSPAALTAAHNLPLHDAEWNRLQKELIEVLAALMLSPSRLGGRADPPFSLNSQLDSDISTMYASLKETEEERARELSVYRSMMEQIDQVRLALFCLNKLQLSYTC
jgi:hypothetical protein